MEYEPVKGSEATDRETKPFIARTIAGGTVILPCLKQICETESAFNVAPSGSSLCRRLLAIDCMADEASTVFSERVMGVVALEGSSFAGVWREEADMRSRSPLGDGSLASRGGFGPLEGREPCALDFDLGFGFVTKRHIT